MLAFLWQCWACRAELKGADSTAACSSGSLCIRQWGPRPAFPIGAKHLGGALAYSCDCRASDEGLWAVAANGQTETLVQLWLMCPLAS